jgi:hypothetical protein
VLEFDSYFHRNAPLSPMKRVPGCTIPMQLWLLCTYGSYAPMAPMHLVEQIRAPARGAHLRGSAGSAAPESERVRSTCCRGGQRVTTSTLLTATCQVLTGSEGLAAGRHRVFIECVICSRGASGLNGTGRPCGRPTQSVHRMRHISECVNLHTSRSMECTPNTLCRPAAERVWNEGPQEGRKAP